MVRKILTWLVVAIIFGLIALWLLGGGIEDIVGNGSLFSFSSIFNASSSLATFQLPFSPQDVAGLVPTEPDGNSLTPGTSAPVLNGADSPYAGDVVLAQGAALAQTPNAQYVVISLSPDAPAVNLAGWSLQSPLSGLRAYLSQGASPFVMGKVNTVGNVLLEPGGVAYVVTGDSPVGVSFSENECTGYLGTLQPFVPALAQQCPSPSTEIPDTPSNVAQLGASCFAYIAQIPPCTFPSHPPGNLSAACVNAIQTKLSYNGCVAAHESDSNFSSNSWRIYLAQGAPLWNAQHDVVRLLDDQGRVVSVLNY